MFRVHKTLGLCGIDVNWLLGRTLCLFYTFGVADNRYAVLRLNIIWPSTYYHSRVVAYQNCITVLLD